MVRPGYQRHNGFDPSPLLPLGALMVVAFMVFSPLTGQMMQIVETSHQVFSFVWVVPLIIVAALFLTSSELLAPSYHHQRRPVAYNRYSSYHPYQSQYGGDSPSWGLLGLMLLMLLMLPWRY